MSLRARLIIAFLILSVVPLSAVTLVWYFSSVRAFERAAEREATETAADIGRRMEMLTANVGRRMDRLFDEAVGYDYRDDAKGMKVQERIAPMLGDTADLVERVEFHPSKVPDPDPDPNPSPHPNPNPNPGVVPSPSRRDARAHQASRGPAIPPPAKRGEHPAGPPPGSPPPPPPPPMPPPAIVVDVPQLMEQVRKTARAHASASGVELGPGFDKAFKDSVPAVEAGIAAVSDAITREVIASTAGKKPEWEVSGRRIEIPVRKDGKLVGKANATLNLDRTLHSVLALARREQGEIPFALDQQNRLYTPDDKGRSTLETLDIAKVAGAAATGKPKRMGDWIIVARKVPGGLIFGIARPIGQSLREIRRLSIRNLSMGLLVIGLACVGIVPISRRMTQHVSSLSEGVRQLASGDFKARVPVRSSDEFGTLATAFNQMAEDLERNQTLVVEQERLHRELELSRLIQTEMLPRARLRLGAAEIKGVSIPAREVGGDFFNYFALPDGRLALLVGDVSGKGVSAALLMANVQATLRARLPLEMDLAKLADGLDRDVDENTPRSVYVTLFLGILDVERSLLRYVNAGHNPQFVLRNRGGIEPLSSTGMPIALYAGHGYKEAVVQIGSGDLLFFYTDGLVETESDTGDMFGAERLQALLATEHAEGIDTVLERVEAAVRAFRGSAEVFDDATMMALRIDT
jgi:serine phosphatase RsbU (regulator of sigma subunit)